MQRRIIGILKVIAVATSLLLPSSNAFCIEIDDLHIEGMEGIRVDEFRLISFIFKATQKPDSVFVRFEGISLSNSTTKPVEKVFHSDGEELHFKFKNGTATASIWFFCPYILKDNTNQVEVWVKNNGIDSNRLRRQVAIVNAPYVGNEEWSSWTPLPNDIKIIPPAGTVPLEIAKFSGVWQGRWKGIELRSFDVPSRRTTLIIEKIGQSSMGFEAQLVYSVGMGINFRQRAYWQRSNGLFEDGVLVFRTGEITIRLEMKDNGRMFGWWLGPATYGTWLERKNVE